MKTVNFIEAVNSERDFGFKNKPAWYVNSGYGDYEDVDIWFSYLVDHGGGAARDIISGEFILEEKSITITESEFDVLWLAKCDPEVTYAEFKKELGF